MRRDQVDQLFAEIRDRSHSFAECLSPEDTYQLAQRFGVTKSTITRLELRFNKFFAKVYRALENSGSGRRS